MCTLLLAWRAHPDLPLVIAANRDEFYARPARPAAFWDDQPDILAGRDDKAGGTWLGITPSGRWAGLTNVRDRGSEGVGVRSRGHLVSEFLSGSASPADYARAVAAEGSAYGGFNLLIGDGDSVWYASNHLPTDEQRRQRAEGSAKLYQDFRRAVLKNDGSRGGAYAVAPGIHGVSNHLLDTPWPKVEAGRDLLRETLRVAQAPIVETDDLATTLLDGLADARPYPDEQLPDTGFGIEWERQLSPLFIATPIYGTCCSTVIAVQRDGQVRFIERTTNPTSPERTVIDERFQLRAH